MKRTLKKFSLKTFFSTILLIATVGLVATDIYLPSFPAMKEGLSTTNTLIQLSFSLYLFTFSLSQLFYGPYSEKHGRKKVALFGLTFSLPGTAICMFSPNITVLILGRMLQGLGLGVGPVIFRAILRDTFSGNALARTYSLVSVGSACMMALAPTLGGYIQSYLGWRYNFFFVALYIIAGIVIIWCWLPETLAKPDLNATKAKTVAKNFFTLIRSPLFISYALCGCLTFVGVTAYLVVSPFLFQEVMGVAPIEYGWLTLVVGISLILGGILNSLFVEEIGRHRMLLYGVLLMTIASLLMLLLAIGFLSVFVIVFPMFLYIVGAGMMFGNCATGALHHFPRIAGFAGALYGALQILGCSIGTSIMAAFHERNQIPLSSMLLIIGLSCLIFQYVGTYQSKKLEKS